MIWNSKDSALSEAAKGFLRSCPFGIRRLESEYGIGLFRTDMRSGTVRVIVNGGGGKGPMWLTFLGEGIADATVSGAMAAAPNAYVLYEMAKVVDDGAGVLFLANHYMGDYLNNDLAVELLAHDGIQARAVFITDDIFSANGEDRSERGGLSGIGQISKISLLYAQEGHSLDDVSCIAQKANSRLRTLCFNLRENRVWFGEGFSGEKAALSMDFNDVDHMMEDVIEMLFRELKEYRKDSFYLSVSSHRSLCVTEEYVLLNSGLNAMDKMGIAVQGAAVGTLFDNYEDKGAMVSLLACDEELRKYAYPVKGHGFVV